MKRAARQFRTVLSRFKRADAVLLEDGHSFPVDGALADALAFVGEQTFTRRTTYVGTHIHTCKHGGHDFTKSCSTGNLHFPVIGLEEMFKLDVLRLRV